MISEKALRAAGMALVGAKWDMGHRLVSGEKLSAIEMAEYEAKAVLKAALPVLLDGKAEEIARLVFVAMRWAAEHSPGPAKEAPHWVERGNSNAQEEARDIANRIISILTGGEDER